MKTNLCYILISTGMGGAEQVVIKMIENIDHSKFNIYLITNNEMKIYFKGKVDEKNILNIGNMYNFSRNNLLNKIINKLNTKIDIRKILIKMRMKKINDFIKKNNIKIAHAHLLYDLYAMTLISTKDIKRIYTIHAFLMIDKTINIYTAFSHEEYILLLLKVDLITTVSSILTQKTIEVLPQIKNNCITIENALDRNNFSIELSQKEINPKQIEFIFMGGEKTVKGGELILDAANILLEKFKQRNFKLTILGPINKNGKFYKKLNKSNEILSHIEIIGFVEPPEHLKYIYGSDIMIMPSYTEGLPLAMFEALKLNKCILASKIPIFDTYIKNNENGILFDLNADSIANTMNQIIINTELLKKIQNNNKIFDIPFWDDIIKKYELHYEKD